MERKKRRKGCEVRFYKKSKHYTCNVTRLVGIMKRITEEGERVRNREKLAWLLLIKGNW